MMNSRAKWDAGMMDFFLEQVDQTGGCTLCFHTGMIPKTGHMVAYGHEKVFNRDMDVADLVAFMDEFRSELAKPEHYLGAWVEKGDVFLDVSIRIQGLKYAMAFGKGHNQKAIWDLTNDKEVRLC